ncbi:MAG: hypothetical protein JNK46_08225 [Methylobacteriaceae bacterium]|nr:hypothetical protein [Methylobacteriaceae bacterium]
MPTGRSEMRRRQRAAAAGGGALDVACARIAMLLDAPRAGRREEASQNWRDAPSVVETLLRAVNRPARPH